MSFFVQNRTIIFFAALLALCSVMVIKQIDTNRSKHVELREAFILLHSRGYKPEAERLYGRLLQELDRLPDKMLLDDFQRTLTLANPNLQQPDNLIWKYHWTVSNEMEKRSHTALKRALKMAEE